MPTSEAHLDAPRALRRVRHREAFNDYLAGVAFVGGAAQAGMPESVLARLVGLGLPLDDLGPWETPAAEASPDLAALPAEPAPDDAPGVSAAHPAPPAPSASPPPRVKYTHSTLPTDRPRRP